MLCDNVHNRKKDGQMKGKKTAAMLLALMMGLTAGCAPGNISRYVQKAQQAGERMFEGATVQVTADGGSTETDEAAAMSREQTPNGDLRSDEAEQESADGQNADGVQQEGAGSEETQAPSEEAEASSGETQAPSGETEAPSEETQASFGETETSSEEGTDSSEEIKLPAMVQEAPAKAQEFLRENAERFSGSLAGSGKLSREQDAAVAAVLAQEDYGAGTICLLNSGSFEGNSGSFLFLADYTSLAARGKMSGDLWFFNGQIAAKAAEDVQLLQLRLVQSGGDSFLLIRTQEQEGERAQLYQVSEGVCRPGFENALSIEETEDGFCVTYASEGKQYDPADRSWKGEPEKLPYYYERGENGFVQQTVRALTQKEYLAYIQPQEKDGQAEEWKEKQEKFFNTLSGENCDYRYSFFAVGEERIGYRQCRVGCSVENGEGADHAVAEYSYAITLLEDGRLTQECAVCGGNGYYFADWENREQEREALEVIPNGYRENRIGKVAQSGSAAEVSALGRVREVQDYPDSGICFIRTADYDGDGGRETFVAAGRYDGAFGAPVCDLWYVSEELPILLLENLPVRSVELCEQEKTFLLLMEGYEKEGASDYLFGVKEGKAQRYLEAAAKIELEGDKDIRAWMKGAEQERPCYYRVQDGEPVEYGLQEREAEALLEYRNGSVVLKRLESLAGGMENLLCLHRENGLWHLMLMEDGSPVSYETYQVQGNALVLTDCGKGGYLAAAENPEEEMMQDGPEGETAEEGAKADEGENTETAEEEEEA